MSYSISRSTRNTQKFVVVDASNNTESVRQFKSTDGFKQIQLAKAGDIPKWTPRLIAKKAPRKDLGQRIADSQLAAYGDIITRDTNAEAESANEVQPEDDGTDVIPFDATTPLDGEPQF